MCVGFEAPVTGNRPDYDLDEGMQPISVFFPYLPTEKHRKYLPPRLSTPLTPPSKEDGLPL